MIELYLIFRYVKERCHGNQLILVKCHERRLMTTSCNITVYMCALTADVMWLYRVKSW